MSTVAVNERVLRWALDRSTLDADDLQGKFPKILQWVAGKSCPTLRQLELLAKVTHTPLGFFFLEKPPEERLPVPYFRTLAEKTPRKPSPDLLETIQTMQRRQAWMREFLVEDGQERLSFVKSARPDEEPAAIAQRIRHAIGFDAGWAAMQHTWTGALDTLREAVEDAGILIFVNGIVGNNTHRKLDPAEFRGFVMVDDYAPLVFVNGADGKAAQMFTLAHELAHVFFGSSAAFDLREMQPANEPTEKACNRVAAEFLIPADEMIQIWSKVKDTPEPFQAVARKFKVSALVAARRALDLALIKKETFLKFYHEYISKEYRSATQQEGGGNFYANQNLRVGRRFAASVIRAAKEGKLLYSEAYRLTGLYGETFHRYAASIGIRGG
jgi:Zn-dependent peptidase ImmA (M78 family)